MSISRTFAAVEITSGSFWKPSRGPTSRILTRAGESITDRRLGRRAQLADVDHAPLVGPDSDRPLPLADLDLESELAAIDDIDQARADGALRPFEGSADVLDADLEADRRPAVRQVLVGEHRGDALHHPDHARGREDPGADRAADVGDEAVRDRERLGALQAGLERHALRPSRGRRRRRGSRR